MIQARQDRQEKAALKINPGPVTFGLPALLEQAKEDLKILGPEFAADFQFMG